MTLQTDRRVTQTAHPLDQLTTDEFRAVRSVLDTAGLVLETTRFAYVGLLEPAKDALYPEASPGTDRRVRVMLWDAALSRSLDIMLSLNSHAVLTKRELDPAVDGQLPVLLEEFDIIEEILAADEQWIAALASRGLTTTQVRVAPLSAGVFSTRMKPGSACCADLASARTTPRTTPGHIRSTDWWPSWTWRTGASTT